MRKKSRVTSELTAVDATCAPGNMVLRRHLGIDQYCLAANLSHLEVVHIVWASTHTAGVGHAVHTVHANLPFHSVPFHSNKERRNMKQSLGRSLELLFLVLQRPCRKRPRLVPRLETATKCLSHQLVAIAIPEGLRAMLCVQVIASFVGGEDALQGTSLLSFYHYIILSINISQESALVLILSDPPPVGLCKTPPHKYCLLDTNNTVSKRSLTHQMSAGGHVKKLQRLAAPLNKNETPTTKHPRGCVRVVEKRGYSSHRI